jgi:iron complex transport system substrate-binding protein
MTSIARRSLLTALGALGAGTALSACGAAAVVGGDSGASGSDAGSGGADGGSGQWPRTIEHELGTVEIASAPQAIVSTSVVLTGSLLAIGAPVIGSGGTAPNIDSTDSHGFFSHWSEVAEERGVEGLYTNSELDLESVQAAGADLIIIAPIGGDSTADQFDQLDQIAPTVAVDYNSHAWEDVTTTLGGILGLEDAAAQTLEDYAAALAGIKGQITPPEEPVQVIAYQGEHGAAFALPDGPHARLLAELGITVADLPEGIEPEEGRGDVAFVSTEVAVANLTASDVLLMTADESTVASMEADPLYENVPALTDGRLVALGLPSFKLDYYAALDLAEHVKAAYAH